LSSKWTYSGACVFYFGVWAVPGSFKAIQKIPPDGLQVPRFLTCLRGSFKGPRGPFEGPRDPLKGPRGRFEGFRGPLKGPRRHATNLGTWKPSSGIFWTRALTEWANLRTKILDFLGLGSSGRPGNLLKGGRAKPSLTFSKGFPAARNRPDLENPRLSLPMWATLLVPPPCPSLFCTGQRSAFEASGS